MSSSKCSFDELLRRIQKRLRLRIDSTQNPDLYEKIVWQYRQLATVGWDTLAASQEGSPGRECMGNTTSMRTMKMSPGREEIPLLDLQSDTVRTVPNQSWKGCSSKKNRLLKVEAQMNQITAAFIEAKNKRLEKTFCRLEECLNRCMGRCLKDHFEYLCISLQYVDRRKTKYPGGRVNTLTNSMMTSIFRTNLPRALKLMASIEARASQRAFMANLKVNCLIRALRSKRELSVLGRAWTAMLEGTRRARAERNKERGLGLMLRLDVVRSMQLLRAFFAIKLARYN